MLKEGQKYKYLPGRERLPLGTIVRLVGGSWRSQRGQLCRVVEDDDISTLYKAIPVETIGAPRDRWYVYQDHIYGYPCIIVSLPDQYECFDCRSTFKSKKIHYLCPDCREKQTCLAG